MKMSNLSVVMLTGLKVWQAGELESLQPSKVCHCCGSNSGSISVFSDTTQFLLLNDLIDLAIDRDEGLVFVCAVLRLDRFARRMTSKMLLKRTHDFLSIQPDSRTASGVVSSVNKYLQCYLRTVDSNCLTEFELLVTKMQSTLAEIYSID